MNKKQGCNTKDKNTSYLVLMKDNQVNWDMENGRGRYGFQCKTIEIQKMQRGKCISYHFHLCNTNTYINYFRKKVFSLTEFRSSYMVL